MKLNNGEIFNAKVPLQKLLQERLPVKVCYALATLAKSLNEQYLIIEQVRNKLVQEHGTPDPTNPSNILVLAAMVVEKDGVKTTVINPEHAKFIEAANELFTQEVEVNFEVVELPDTLETDAATLIALEKFVKVK